MRKALRPNTCEWLKTTMQQRKPHRIRLPKWTERRKQDIARNKCGENVKQFKIHYPFFGISTYMYIGYWIVYRRPSMSKFLQQKTKFRINFVMKIHLNRCHSIHICISVFRALQQKIFMFFSFAKLWALNVLWAALNWELRDCI